MVSISKSRIKPRRKAKTREELKTEAMVSNGLLGLFGLLVLYALMKLLSLGMSSSSPSSTTTTMRGGGTTTKSSGGGSMADTIHLNFDSELDASYRAIALDIVETLDCYSYMNQTTASYDNFDNNFEDFQNNGMGGGDTNAGGEEEYTDDDDLVIRRRRRRRRLDETNLDDDNDDNTIERRDIPAGGNYNEGEKAEWMGDDFPQGEERMMDDFKMDYIDENYQEVSGTHLFCLAALSTIDDTVHAYDKQIEDYWKSKITCDAANTKQQTLLDLWSSARAEMPEEILKKTLSFSRESSHDLYNRRLYLWAPFLDEGINYMIQVLNNEEQNADHGGGSIHGLQENLGSGKTFVDIGSCLGVTTLAVTLLYPGTRVVSIEPAAPNWLLQEMNLRCNLLTSQHYPTVLLSGVGPQHHTSNIGSGTGETPSIMAKFLWRPQATTATRAWTPRDEKTGSDIELLVKLKSWNSLLDEAGIAHTSSSSTYHINVLNVDCEGCEYNLIPSLTDDEYNNIETVMGGVHWGYIPKTKLPSSERAKKTHERLCKHENFARTSKECCAFPNLQVKSSVPGEILINEEDDEEDGRRKPNLGIPKESTVIDVAGELCDDFEEWSTKNLLFQVDNDFGWFQLSSMAN